MKNMVLMVVSDMFAMLFPTRIAVSRRSYFSSSFKTFAADLLPAAARLLSLILLKEVYAVSVAEKKAESATSKIIASSINILSLSI